MERKKLLSRISMQAGTLIVMVRRGKETAIPTGNTVVYEGGCAGTGKILTKVTVQL